jgi:hypothetical protein
MSLVNDSPKWSVTGQRDILLDLFTNPEPIRSLKPVRQPQELVPREGDVALVWHNPAFTSSTFPEAIVGHKATLEDLFAWAATYLRGIGPLSSNARVLNTHEAELLFAQSRDPMLERIETAVAALIIVEVLVLVRNQIRIEDVSVTACESTLSFLIARGLANGRSSYALDQLPDQWERVRRITVPNASSNETRAISTTCRLVAKAFNKTAPSLLLTGDLIGECLKRITEEGRITRTIISRLASSFDGLPDELTLASIPDLSPQDRVVRFDSIALIILKSDRTSRDERAFALALVASLCKPGSLQQFNLLREHPEGLPESMLWFGVIQGLHKSNDVLNLADGLGRRILREILQYERILDRPRSDISIQELEVLLRGNVQPSIRTAVWSQICVEVQPGIYSTARWKPRGGASLQGELQMDLPKEEVHQRDPLDELAATLRYAANLVEDARRRTRESGQSGGSKKRKRY